MKTPLPPEARSAGTALAAAVLGLVPLLLFLWAVFRLRAPASCSVCANLGTVERLIWGAVGAVGTLAAASVAALAGVRSPRRSMGAIAAFALAVVEIAVLVAGLAVLAFGGGRGL